MVLPSGRDDASALTQLKSKTSNDDAFATIEAMSVNVVDREFLMWGDDNGAAGLETSVTGTDLERMARIWRVQETGDTGTVTVSIPQYFLGVQPASV